MSSLCLWLHFHNGVVLQWNGLVCLTNFDQLFTFCYCQTSHSLWVTMAPMLYFATVFVNWLFFAPAVEVTTQMSLFFDTALDNFIFTSNVLFESESRSVLDCGRQCFRDERCVTFTNVTRSSSGSCRGHNATLNSTSDHGATVTGAKTFTRSGKVN